MIYLGLVCFTFLANDPTSKCHISYVQFFGCSKTMQYLSNPSPSVMWANCAGGHAADTLDTLPMSPQCATAAAAAAAAVPSPEQSLSPTVAASERRAQYQGKDNTKKAEAMQGKNVFCSFGVCWGIHKYIYADIHHTNFSMHHCNKYGPSHEKPTCHLPTLRLMMRISLPGMSSFI